MKSINRNRDADLSFSNILWFLDPISGGTNSFCPSADTHESSFLSLANPLKPSLLKNTISLKTFQVIWLPKHFVLFMSEW